MIGYSKQQQLQGVQKEKKLYKIPQISKKKKERLKNEGTEKDVFKKVWKGVNICGICGNRILEPSSFVFAHILSKKQFKEFRLIENNIFKVCSISCHSKLDKKITDIKRAGGLQELKRLILSGNEEKLKQFIKT